LKERAEAQTDVMPEAQPERQMPSRYDRDRQFDLDTPDNAAQDWCNPQGFSEADLMRGLQLASDTVLRLATQTHAAVARGDAVSAEVNRVCLEKQLELTTRLIDELLFDGEPQHTTH
jgi:hypothetical protein